MTGSNTKAQEISTEEFMKTNTYQCLIKGQSTIEYLSKVQRDLQKELIERENSTYKLIKYVNSLFDQERKLNEKIVQMKVQNDSDLERIEYV